MDNIDNEDEISLPSNTHKSDNESMNFDPNDWYEGYDNTIQEYLNNDKLNCFLISTKTIPNFMKNIEKSKILDSYNTDKYLERKRDLKRIFADYKDEKDYKIYKKYNNCLKILKENDPKENEFIFIEDKFIRVPLSTCKIIGRPQSPSFGLYKDLVTVDKEKMVLKFKESKKTLSFQEKKLGIFKFIKSKDNKALQKYRYNSKKINYKTVKLKLTHINNQKDSGIININEKDYEEEKYIYELDTKISKYLDNKLNKISLKLNDDGKLIEMNDGKIGLYEKVINIYETKSFTRLHQIKIKNIVKIHNIIELDNKDLVIMFDQNYSTKIRIYKLKNGKYILFQKINQYDDNINYNPKYEIRKVDGLANKYHFIWIIRKLSGNRFIIGSNYGFKIYSLMNTENSNESKYIYTFKNDLGCYEGIIDVYEINNNQLIIISGHCIDLFNINKNKIEKRIIKNENIHLAMLTNNNNSEVNLSYVLLKQKYFIFNIYNEIYIFDIIQQKIIKSFLLKYKYIQLMNWISKDDDLFILRIEVDEYDDFTLIKFDEKKILLKLLDVQKLKILVNIYLNSIIKINSIL